MTISDEYAAFCAELSPASLPEPVHDRARRLLIDVAGIAVGASRAASTPSIISAARTLDDGGDGATVLATGESMRPASAAFVNASLAHSLDYDETHRGGAGHPPARGGGAALAAAEAVGADGDRLLAAIVGGYEVTARLGMALSPASHMARGFHGTATCGTFGATAAVGIVRDHDPETLAAAFGLNGSQAAGSLQFLEDGTWNKRVHPGFAARAAHESVALAEAGFDATEAPIGGKRGFLTAYSDDPKPALATEGLGETFEILNAGVKPYPCCRYMHAAMDGLLELTTDADLDPADVEAIEIGLPAAGADVVDPTKPYPETVVDAQFSMPYTAALLLHRRRAAVEDFLAVDSEALPTEWRRLIDATTVATDEWADSLYPDRWAATVRVETAEATHERRIESARGDRETPLTATDLREKFEELAEPVIGDAASGDLYERLHAVADRDVADVVEPVHRARAEGRIRSIDGV